MTLLIDDIRLKRGSDASVRIASLNLGEPVVGKDKGTLYVGTGNNNKIRITDTYFFSNASEFPTTGIIDKLYIDKSSGEIYIWNGVDNYILCVGGSIGGRDIRISLGGYTYSHRYWYTKNKCWSIARMFIFDGTFVSTPVRFDILAAVERYGGEVRIYDSTNNKVICEITGINNNDSENNPEIYSTTNLSNLPAGTAIWQLQARHTKKKRIYLYEAIVRF